MSEKEVEKEDRREEDREKGEEGSGAWEKRRGREVKNGRGKVKEKGKEEGQREE